MPEVFLTRIGVVILCAGCCIVTYTATRSNRDEAFERDKALAWGLLGTTTILAGIGLALRHEVF